MLVLTRSDVRKLIDAGDIIDAVEAAHAALATGAAAQAVEGHTPLMPGDGTLLPMTAALATTGTAGVKVLTDVRANTDRGLHPQTSTITLVEADTGQCIAFLDGIEVTLHRTAAASAVATKHLAREDARTLGLIGAGAQATSHLRALRRVRDFERVVVWSRTRVTAERFAAGHADDPLPVTILDSAEAVVRESEVLCTLTPSHDPVVLGEWFRPGLHINAVGAPPRADHREIDTVGIQRSTVVVDHRQTALEKSGEIVIPLTEGSIDVSHVHAELGELVAGTRPGRTGAEQITLFDSVGLAIQDIATAAHLVAAATAAGIGTTVPLTS